MASHAERVLAGIINKENPRRDLLGVAVLRLSDEHFTQEAPKLIYKVLKMYYDKTGAVCPRESFILSLESSGVPASKILLYTQNYDNIANLGIGEPDFKWSVDELRDEHAKRLTGRVITEAMEILERGYDGKQGHEDAREFLTSKIHEIDLEDVSDSAPEGNIFLEYEAVREKYEDRKSGKIGKGILSGIAAIDSRTDGWQRGELIMICAGPGVGKSMISTQGAWDAAVTQGKDVFFATSETLRDQVIRRIIARHSRMSQFDHAINSADLKKGTLSEADEKVLADVLEDWHYNSAYGNLNVVQIPAGGTLSYVDNRLKDMAREHEVELCVIDYLALLKSETKRNSEREEFNEIIRNAKGIAQGFSNGLGIPVVSPWQLTREAYDHGLRVGHYTKASLSDTSEAEKSADQIIAILREEDNNDKMSLQFLKMRDDEIPPITEVAIDLRHTYIGNYQTANRSMPTNGQSLLDLTGIDI